MACLYAGMMKASMCPHVQHEAVHGVAKVFDLLLCAGALDWVDGQPIVSEELECKEDVVEVVNEIPGCLSSFLLAKERLYPCVWKNSYLRVGILTLA